MKLPKLTINRKLLLSYLSMALLTVLSSAYAVVSLQNLNKLAYNITNQDYIVLDNSKQMMDALLTQESTEKKALIFKDPSFATIFRTRGQEFKKGIERIRKYNLSGFNPKLAQLSSLQDEYHTLFQQELALMQESRTDEALLLSEKKGKQYIDAMASHVRFMGKRAEQEIDTNIRLFKDESLQASRITIALSIISLISGFTLAILITYNIARPLKKLEKATGLIAEGKFDNDLNMNLSLIHI